MSSGKQTLPQSPWMTTGTPQMEHQVGSSFRNAYDIWPGTLIYYLTRTSMQLNAIGKKIPNRIFVNVLDCDFTGKLAINALPGQPPGPSDVVALYLQAHSGTPVGGCNIFALNAVLDRTGIQSGHCAEFDINNNSGHDDPPYGDATSSVCVDIEAGASKNSNLFGLVISQGQLAAGYKPFRQALSIYQAFDTLGIELKAAVSNPDAYIQMVPWDDLNPTSRMIKLLNAAQTKEVFMLEKDGIMKLANPTLNSADCILLNTTISGGTGVLLTVRNGTTTKDVAYFNADRSMQFFGTLGVQVIAGTACLALYQVSDAYGRLLIADNGGLAWGPGNAAQDTNLYRGGVGQLTTDNSFRVNGTLLSIGAITTNSDVISYGSTGHKGKHAASDSTQGISTSITYMKDSAGTAGTLVFKDGLLTSSS